MSKDTKKDKDLCRRCELQSNVTGICDQSDCALFVTKFATNSQDSSISSSEKQSVTNINQLNTEDWREEFDQKFLTCKCMECYMSKDRPIETKESVIKSFIAEKRAEAREEGFNAGGQTKGGTGRIMYERGLVAGIKEERERILETVKALINYPCNCDRKMISCVHKWDDAWLALLNYLK